MLPHKRLAKFHKNQFAQTPKKAYLGSDHERNMLDSCVNILVLWGNENSSHLTVLSFQFSQVDIIFLEITGKINIVITDLAYYSYYTNVKSYLGLLWECFQCGVQLIHKLSQ